MQPCKNCTRKPDQSASVSETARCSLQFDGCCENVTRPFHNASSVRIDDLEVPHLGCKKSPPTATNAAFSGAMRNSRTFPQCVRKLVPRDSMVFRDSSAETFYGDKLAGFTDFSETTKRTSLKFCYTFEAGFPSFGKKWALMRFLLGRRTGEIPIASCFEPERSEDC